MKGRPAAEVASFIQDAQGLLDTVPRDKLVTLLRAYRTSLSPAELAMGYSPEAVVDAIATVRDGIDEVQEMALLYRMQVGRIEVDAKSERTIGKLLPGVRQEIALAMELLTSSAKLKLALGLDEPGVDEVQVTETLIREVSARTTNPQVVKLMHNPEARQRLLSLVRDIRSVTLATRASEEEPVEAQGVTTSESTGDTALGSLLCPSTSRMVRRGPLGPWKSWTRPFATSSPRSLPRSLKPSG